MYQNKIPSSTRQKMLNEIRDQISEGMSDEQLVLLGAGRIAFAICPWGLPDELVQIGEYFARDFPDRALEEHYSLWKYDRNDGPGPYMSLGIMAIGELYDMNPEVLSRLSRLRLGRYAAAVRLEALKTFERQFEEACTIWEDTRIQNDAASIE